MGKALVIKNVDFGTNKLTTVTLVNEVPCTAIALNKSSTTLANIGTTETLTATVTPANTTDSVVWASSNSSIVEVVNGVLTCKGVGSATITATCGNYSATCTVTTTNALSFNHRISAYCRDGGTGDVKYGTLTSGSSPYAGCFSNTGETGMLKLYNAIDQSDYKYPIKLSEGTSKVSFDVPSEVRATVWFMNSTAGSSQYNYYAAVVSGDASPYDSNVPTGDREVTVPSGADSLIFSLNYPSGTVTDEIVAGITVTES